MAPRLHSMKLVFINLEQLKIKEKVKTFLETFEVIAIDKIIATQAIPLRQKHKIKLPDALILATAESVNALLISRDAKAFGKEIPILRIPYKL
jgi:predicted nucleic acid-binding protein